MGVSSVGLQVLDSGVKLRDVAELGVTLLQQLVDGQSAELCKVPLKFFADQNHGFAWVVVGSTSGFAQNIVDAAHQFDVACGVFESRGGLLFFACVLPQKSRALLKSAEKRRIIN